MYNKTTTEEAQLPVAHRLFTITDQHENQGRQQEDLTYTPITLHCPAGAAYCPTIAPVQTPLKLGHDGMTGGD
jgi:hypothetical protein